MPFAPPNPTTHTAPRRRWRASSLALIVSAWAILQLGGLFTPGLLDDVDSIYIQVAREMLQRHDLVTPTIDGIRFFDKPPLMYWMAAGSMHLFGIHDWAARLPLALGVLALLLAVYALGIRFYSHPTALQLPPSARDSGNPQVPRGFSLGSHDPAKKGALAPDAWAPSPSIPPDRAGLYAALAMATAIGPYLYTRFYIPDILIALWMTLSVHLFLIALERVNASHTPNVVISTEGAPLRRSGEIPVFPRPTQNAVIATGARSAQWRDPQLPPPQVPQGFSLGSHNPSKEEGALAPEVYPPSWWRQSALLPCLAFAAVTALNLLTKGLIGIVFPIGFALLYLAFTHQLHLLRKLHLIPSTLVFLIIAAPWHILAAIRNPPIAMPPGLGLPAHAGWAWFYLYNEHIARFLGRRIPHDYGQVPIPIFWALLLLWLFPWVAFLPAALADAYRTLRRRTPTTPGDPPSRPPLSANVGSQDPGDPSSRPPLGAKVGSQGAPGLDSRAWVGKTSSPAQNPPPSAQDVSETHNPVPRGFSLGSHSPADEWALAPEVCFPQPTQSRQKEAALSNLLWAGIILGFFTLSSRQEYYHLPALPALALLVGGFLAAADARFGKSSLATPAVRVGPVRAGLRSSLYGLVPLCTLLALLTGYFALTAPTPHPGLTLNDALSSNPALYDLSLGHIFDLTTQAMGFFRGPLLTVALCMLALGPIAWLVRRRNPFAANLLIAAAMIGTLTAAHAGLVRFYPILGSKPLAEAIDAQYHPGDLIILDGELTSGSTLLFYTPQSAAPVLLVNGRINGPWFGSFWPHNPAPDGLPSIFLNDAQLAHLWHGPHRIFLLTYNPKTRTADLFPYAPVHTFATAGGKTILTNR
ncbi:MAG: glycosyltransferase family 39 protein [Acidobacteriaceae bacterium]